MNSQEKVKKIKKLVEELEELAELPGKPFGKPMSPLEIQEIETKLNLKLPQEYKEFLQTFGSLSVIRTEPMGGQEIIPTTLSLRGNYPDTFSHNLVVVRGDGYGNYHCVVCDGKDYGKVVFWQHDAPLNEVYPNYPEGKPDFWIEGPDFWTWLLEDLKSVKKIEEEEKKK